MFRQLTAALPCPTTEADSSSELPKCWCIQETDWLVNSSNDSSYTCCTCTLVVYSPSLVLTRIKNLTAPPSPLPQGQRPYFPPMQYPRPNQWGGAPGVGGTTRPYGQSGYGRGGRGGGRMGGVSRGVSQQPSGAPARNPPTQPRPTPPTMPGASAPRVKYTSGARNHPAPQGTECVLHQVMLMGFRTTSISVRARRFDRESLRQLLMELMEHFRRSNVLLALRLLLHVNLPTSL